MATSPVHSDVFVFFGMSGDLAHKKIFPALYSMVKHGTLDIPVIGVASSKWTVAGPPRSRRESITTFGGGVDDKAAFDKLTVAAEICRRRLHGPGDVQGAEEGDG